MPTTEVASSISAANIASASESLLNIGKSLAEIEMHIQEQVQSSSAFSSSDWIAITSAIIAIIALVFSAYQAYLTRNHNKLSVKPHLDLLTERNKNTFKNVLRNDGLGPALITSAIIKFNSMSFDLFSEESKLVFLTELAKSIAQDLNDINFVTFNGVSSLRAEGELELFSFTTKDKIDYNSQFTICVEYQSMYGVRMLLTSAFI